MRASEVLYVGPRKMNHRKFTIDDTQGYHGNYRKSLAQNSVRSYSVTCPFIHYEQLSGSSRSQLFCFAPRGTKLQHTLAVLEFTASRKSDVVHLVHISHYSNLADINYWSFRMVKLTRTKQNLSPKGNERLESELEK